MNLQIRVAMLSVAVLSLAGILLMAEPPDGTAPAAQSVRSGGLSAIARPPARFHPPTDGGPSPWSAGVHAVRGSDGATPATYPVLRRAIPRPPDHR